MRIKKLTRRERNMSITIRDILKVITNPLLLPENTVDRLEYGDPDFVVKGVATTFIASQEAIEQAISMGVNFIISHEGIFFSHRDRQQMLREDPVYLEKRRLIKDNSIAVYRYHDGIHKCMPDGIMTGLLQSLKWQNYETESSPTISVLEMPAMELHDVITHIKKELGIGYIRAIGDLSAQCKRIGVLVGYRGHWDSVIPLFEKQQPDLVIYGEGPEWEVPEYVRDAVQQGRHKALIVLGHAESEMSGMKYLARQLQVKFPELPVCFIPQKPVFQVC